MFTSLDRPSPPSQPYYRRPGLLNGMNNFFSLHISVGCYNNAVPAIAAKTFVSAADSCFINLLKCISGHTIKLMLCFTKGYQDFSAASKMRREIKKSTYLSVNVFSTKY